MPNLFQDLPDTCPDEVVDILVSSDNVRIKRIISDGHASPDGFWYDQKDHEWVVLLQGSATLEFEDREPVHLQPGDWLEIPAHQKHRVEQTSDETRTIWLAIFWRSSPAQNS